MERISDVEWMKRLDDVLTSAPMAFVRGLRADRAAFLAERNSARSKLGAARKAIRQLQSDNAALRSGDEIVALESVNNELRGENELLAADNAALRADVERLREDKDGAYEERNRLVALLASMFPSGLKSTDIPGWNPEWHGCVYIDLPWGQASWHFHDSQAHLFAGLQPYPGEWDGHTTEGKYEAIARAALGAP